LLSLERAGVARVDRKRAKAEQRRLHPRWPWLAPVLVALVVLLLPFYLVKAIGAVVAIGVIALIRRRPVGALMALLILVPFQLQIFPALYRIGVPAQVVRPLGQWKEIVVVGVLAAAWSKARRERHRLDVLDWLAIGYVALGVAYLVVPKLFVGDQIGSTLDFSTRLLGWRTDVMYVALFIACRHLRFDEATVRRLIRTFVRVAIVVSGVAFYEFFFSSSWNHFMVDTLQLSRYKLDILGVNPFLDHTYFDIRIYTKVGGHSLLRAGSVMLNYWTLGYYMVAAAAVLTDRIVRGLARPVDYIALGMACAATLFTNTRSAVLALAVVLVVTMLRRSRRTPRAERARIQFALVLGAVAIFAVPGAFAVGLVSRFNGQDDYSSNQGHATNFDISYRTLVEHPLGRGLATAAGAGQRADVNGRQVTETQYLQIGTQLGVIGLVLWVGTLVGGIVVAGKAVRRAPPQVDTAPLTSMRTALIGLLVAGVFLQVFLDFALSWTVWLLAGAALGAVHGDDRTVEPARRYAALA